jgi:hypothetical protein
MPPYSTPVDQGTDVTADGYQLAKCGRLEPCGRLVKVIFITDAIIFTRLDSCSSDNVNRVCH